MQVAREGDRELRVVFVVLFGMLLLTALGAGAVPFCGAAVISGIETNYPRAGVMALPAVFFGCVCSHQNNCTASATPLAPASGPGGPVALFLPWSDFALAKPPLKANRLWLSILRRYRHFPESFSSILFAARPRSVTDSGCAANAVS